MKKPDSSQTPEGGPDSEKAGGAESGGTGEGRQVYEHTPADLLPLDQPAE